MVSSRPSSKENAQFCGKMGTEGINTNYASSVKAIWIILAFLGGELRYDYSTWKVDGNLDATDLTLKSHFAMFMRSAWKCMLQTFVSYNTLCCKRAIIIS